MKNFTLMTILIFAAGCAASNAQTAHLQNQNNQPTKFDRETRIKFENACQNALKRFPGTIENSRQDDKRHVYSFDIRNAQNEIIKVQISQINGQIVSFKPQANDNNVSSTSANSNQTKQDSDDENDKIPFVVQTNPTTSNPAEFQRPGVLQIAYGYNSNFRAADTPSVQDAPLKLRFAASRRVLLELDFDSVITQTAPDKTRQTGVGDTMLGIQYVVHYQSKLAPGAAFAYYVKLPSASSAKGLGTGRVDSNFIGLFSKKFGAVTVDFNATYLLAGRSDRNGHTSSGQSALAFSYSFTKRIGGVVEFSGYSRSNDSSGAVFALSGVSYQVNHRFYLYGGARFGLTPDSPRIGVLFGFTAGIANLYKKHG